MTITISNGSTADVFYNVPKSVAKAIITILKECENDASDIVSAVEEEKGGE